MKHTQKVKLARKIMEKDSYSLFSSKSWTNRASFIRLKETLRNKNNILSK